MFRVTAISPVVFFLLVFSFALPGSDNDDGGGSELPLSSLSHGMKIRSIKREVGE